MFDYNWHKTGEHHPMRRLLRVKNTRLFGDFDVGYVDQDYDGRWYTVCELDSTTDHAPRNTFESAKDHLLTQARQWLHRPLIKGEEDDNA